MQFKRQSNQTTEINLTPLIDVVFLLLIFFMVSTTFVKQSHLKLTLPEAEFASEVETTGNIEVVIDQNGFYTINEKKLINTNPETLKSALINLSENNFTMPLTITSDANAPYQAVVTIIDIGGKLGFSKINVTTEKKTVE